MTARNQGLSSLATGPAVFAALQGLAAFGLYWTTLTPGYRGGPFLQVLLLTVGVLSVLTVAAEAFARAGNRPGTADPAGAAVGLPLLTAATAAVVVVIGAAGLYVGSAVLLFGYWLAVVRVRPIKALFLALLFGTAMPILFSYLIGTRLWPGAMPTIIRHYLGGGTLPPL